MRNWHQKLKPDFWSEFVLLGPDYKTAYDNRANSIFRRFNKLPDESG